MCPVRSAYAGGYSDTIKARLNGVALPHKIKCEVCKKFRMQSAFSNRQLNAVRNAVVLHGQEALSDNRPGFAKCRQCSGGQTAELHCSACDKTKDLNEFSKAQRRNPDTARCINCVQSHLETEPIAEETKLIGGSEWPTNYGSSADNSQYDEDTVRKSSRSFSLDEASTQFDAISQDTSASVSALTEDDDEDCSVGGGVWVEPDREDFKHQSRETKHRGFTAFDPQGVAHCRVSTELESTKSIHSGWESWGVSPTSVEARQDFGRQDMEENRRRNKWGKVPGRRFEKHEAPTMRIPESQGPVLDESDDDDDDYDIQDYL